MSDDKPWEPPALPAEKFHLPGQWTNINRAPHDVISGVIYKPAMHIKSVRYEPLDAAPDMPELWQGQGGAIVRWLFSEKPGTEESIMTGAEFLFLQDIVLDPGASGGQQRHAGENHLLYVIAGEGTLYHRACLGCPVVSRPCGLAMQHWFRMVNFTIWQIIWTTRLSGFYWWGSGNHEQCCAWLACRVENGDSSGFSMQHVA